MRYLVLLLLALFLIAPAAAQDSGGAESYVYTSKRYQVRIVGPPGWDQTLTGPKSAGSWVNLVRFTETRTRATALLSVAATQYRTADEMIESLTRTFEKDSTLAILRKETRSAAKKRPKGIIFEYTTQGKTGPIHMFAAYYLNRGQRYRVLGTVKEAAWRTVGTDIEKFAGAIEFTGRLFREDVQNFTDEPRNFAMYYPEDWTVKLPARGPQVAFTSKQLGVAVWVYVAASEGTLKENVDGTEDDVKRARGKIIKRDREKTHPALGLKTVLIEYSKPTSSGTKYFYREIAMQHRDRYYRFSLVGTGNAVKGAQNIFEKMIGAINFLK